VSSRNLIDYVYNQTLIIYSVEFVIYIIGFVVPFLLQVFVTGETGTKVCLFICLGTLCLFVVNTVLQIAYLKMDFFMCNSHRIELVNYVLFIAYVVMRLGDSRNYLPENIRKT
jgi:hypothetical protein